MKIKDLKFDRKTTGWLLFIHLGCLLAPFTFTWAGLWTCIFVYWLTGGIGISLGFHRLLTHRSFRVPKWLEYVITVLGCCAAQRSPIWWVAGHRKHHGLSDKPGDPHSPRDGFLWSHMIWCMADLRVEDENQVYGRFAPDLAEDKGHRFIQKTHELWPLLLGAGLWIFGGFPVFVWGFFVRTAVVYHVTWLVNSLGHIWGYQNYDCGDNSMNNPLIALLAFGEGWHNNHHAKPNAAAHGQKWWEFDLTYVTLRLMVLLGLAKDLRPYKVSSVAA